MSEQQLDTRGLLCPMPVIKTQNAIQDMNVGDTLKVLASDPGVLHDIPSWCRVNGHKVVSANQDGRDIEIIVEVCSS
ncbi:MAG: sulfurtransferase TusA family protein [Pseudomonadales bacterium]|nr:sulfurtransferase TusA family protein [Pseudomonadales bacterium]